MSTAVAKVQTAIWRTEEAIELQKMRIAEAQDPHLVALERHGLVTLEDVLDIHRRTLGFLLAIPETPTHRAHMREAQQGLH